MKGIKLVLITIGILAIVILAFLFLVGYLSPKNAGIQVDSKPASSVFIDGIQVGRTPYEATRTPGEIVLKLVPESTDKTLVPFETKVTVGSGIKTIVRREFGETEEKSSGEIISFEKIGGQDASLSLVSWPDAAQISIDGSVRGFAPYKISSIVAGEHQIIISAPGYQERTLSLKTYTGYKLTAVVKLAGGGGSIATPTPNPQSEENTQVTVVEILSTPTGFLRVRKEPSSGASEIGRVKPGQKFDLLEESDKKDWYKIEYEKGKEGWISAQYARKVSPSPTPTSKPSSTPKLSPTLTPKPTAKPGQ
jgi:hypothetical protein